MSNFTRSPTSKRDEGLRSPFRFPDDYNLYNADTTEFQDPTPEDGFQQYATSAASMYTASVAPFHTTSFAPLEAVKNNTPDPTHAYLNDLGADYNLYQGTRPLEPYSNYNYNYSGNQQASPSLSANGELQFNQPALGLDQMFGFNYQSPSPPVQRYASAVAAHQSPIPATPTSPPQTFKNTAPPQNCNNTVPSRNNMSADWLLTEPVSNQVQQASEVLDSPCSPKSMKPKSTKPHTIKPQKRKSQKKKKQKTAQQTMATPKSTTPNSPTPEPITPANSAEMKTKTKNFFDNEEAFLAAKSRVAWRAPANDDSILQTAAQKRAVIDAVVAAILNNEGCVGQNTRSFENRWKTGANFYEAEDIEIVAWELMTAMANIHTKGWNKRIGDPSLREQIEKTKEWTFEERLNKVIELLKVSKRTCEDLLKGDDPYAVIGIPDVLLKRTKSNESSNKRKGERIRRASEMEKQEAAKGKKRVREDEDEDEKTEVEQAPRPRTRASRIKRARKE